MTIQIVLKKPTDTRFNVFDAYWATQKGDPTRVIAENPYDANANFDNRFTLKQLLQLVKESDGRVKILGLLESGGLIYLSSVQTEVARLETLADTNGVATHTNGATK